MNMKLTIKFEYQGETYHDSQIIRGNLFNNYASDIAEIAKTLTYNIINNVFYITVKQPDEIKRIKEVQNDENIEDFDDER